MGVFGCLFFKLRCVFSFYVDTPESTYVLPPGATKTSSRTSTSGSPTTSSTQTKGGGGSSNTGAIAGGVAGGIVGLALIAAIGYLLLRKPSQVPKPVPLNGGSSQGVPSYTAVPTQQPHMTSIQGTNEWPMSPNTHTNPNPSTTYSGEVPSFPPTEYVYPPFFFWLL